MARFLRKKKKTKLSLSLPHFRSIKTPPPTKGPLRRPRARLRRLEAARGRGQPPLHQDSPSPRAPRLDELESESFLLVLGEQQQRRWQRQRRPALRLFFFLLKFQQQRPRPRPRPGRESQPPAPLAALRHALGPPASQGRDFSPKPTRTADAPGARRRGEVEESEAGRRLAQLRVHDHEPVDGKETPAGKRREKERERERKRERKRERRRRASSFLDDRRQRQRQAAPPSAAALTSFGSVATLQLRRVPASPARLIDAVIALLSVEKGRDKEREFKRKRKRASRKNARKRKKKKNRSSSRSAPSASGAPRPRPTSASRMPCAASSRARAGGSAG